jgi:hypothetical protein
LFEEEGFAEVAQVLQLGLEREERYVAGYA